MSCSVLSLKAGLISISCFDLLLALKNKIPSVHGISYYRNYLQVTDSPLSYICKIKQKMAVRVERKAYFVSFTSTICSAKPKRKNIFFRQIPFRTHQTLLMVVCQRHFYYKGFVPSIHDCLDVYQDFPFPKFKIELGYAFR